MNPHDHAIAELVLFYEQLSPASLGQLGRHYAPDARFKDPFHEVQGVPAIEAIFTHMFGRLQQPRFVVSTCVVQGEQAFLLWDFEFRFAARGQAASAGALQTIRGCSHLLLGPDSRVRLHRDYWDAAEELYEKLPLLGTLMRWLKRRAGA